MGTEKGKRVSRDERETDRQTDERERATVEREIARARERRRERERVLAMMRTLFTNDWMCL